MESEKRIHLHYWIPICTLSLSLLSVIPLCFAFFPTDLVHYLVLPFPYYFFYPLLSIVALGVGGTAINKKTVSGLRKVLTGVGVTLAVIGFILYLMILPAALAWTRFR